MTAQVLPQRLTSAAFLGQSGAILAANLAQAATPFCSLLLIGRRHGLAAAGDYALIQSLIVPLFQFLSLQLKPLLLTHHPAELPLSGIMPLRWLATLAAALLAAALYIFAGPLALILTLSRLVDSWAEIYQASWQREGHSHRAMFASLLRAACTVLLLLAAPNVNAAFFGLLLCSAAILLFYERHRDRLPAPPQPSQVVTLLRNGLLLGVVLFLVTCSGSIPRVALEHWAGPAALGAFATLTVFQQAGNLVASSYGQSLLPRLRQAPLGTIAFWVSVPSLWAIAALLPAYVLRDAIVEFIMPNAPSGISEVFLALTLAQVLAWPAAVIGCALTAKRLYRPQIYVAVLSAAASAIAASLLVPPFAALGAVATLALASATTLLCGFVLLASHESVKAIS